MKIVVRIVGVLLALAGAVWALQGANVLPGSFMTGQVEWLIIGVISVVVGIGMIAASAQLGRSSSG